jgi:hypothetical protein
MVVICKSCQCSMVSYSTTSHSFYLVVNSVLCWYFCRSIPTYSVGFIWYVYIAREGSTREFSFISIQIREVRIYYASGIVDLICGLYRCDSWHSSLLSRCCPYCSGTYSSVSIPCIRYCLPLICSLSPCIRLKSWYSRSRCPWCRWWSCGVSPRGGNWHTFIIRIILIIQLFFLFWFARHRSIG